MPGVWAEAGRVGTLAASAPAAAIVGALNRSRLPRTLCAECAVDDVMRRPPSVVGGQVAKAPINLSGSGVADRNGSTRPGHILKHAVGCFLPDAAVLAHDLQ